MRQCARRSAIMAAGGPYLSDRAKRPRAAELTARSWPGIAWVTALNRRPHDKDMPPHLRRGALHVALKDRVDDLAMLDMRLRDAADILELRVAERGEPAPGRGASSRPGTHCARRDRSRRGTGRSPRHSRRTHPTETIAPPAMACSRSSSRRSAGVMAIAAKRAASDLSSAITTNISSSRLSEMSAATARDAAAPRPDRSPQVAGSPREPASAKRRKPSQAASRRAARPGRSAHGRYRPQGRSGSPWARVRRGGI